MIMVVAHQIAVNSSKETVLMHYLPATYYSGREHVLPHWGMVRPLNSDHPAFRSA